MPGQMRQYEQQLFRQRPSTLRYDETVPCLTKAGTLTGIKDCRGVRGLPSMDDWHREAERSVLGHWLHPAAGAGQYKNAEKVIFFSKNA